MLCDCTLCLYLIRPFINALCQAGRDNGMNISCDPEVRDGGRRMEDAFKGFRNNPQLIVVILDHSTSYSQFVYM